MNISLTVQPPTTQLLLIGHGSKDPAANAEYHRLAQRLARRLDITVQSAFLEFADPPIVEGLRHCVATGAERVVALPLFLGAATHQKNDVPTILNWAKSQWPTVSFGYGVPLGAQPALVDALAHNLALAVSMSPQPEPMEPADTAILLVGRGSRDPDSNAEVYKIARLLYEGRAYNAIEVAFYDLTTPTIDAMIARAVKLGARRVVVLPYLLFVGRIATRIAERVEALRPAYPQTELLVGAPLGVSELLIEAVVNRYQQVLAGTAAMNCDNCKYRRPLTGFEAEAGLPQGSDHNHGMRGLEPWAPNGILPPRYQNSTSVSAAAMRAAPLSYDADGQVAWDKIWGKDDPNSPFCELALAGGPPHRGQLLEPVTPDLVQADLAGYQQVLTELSRAIQMTTGLQTQPGAALGWLAVVCSGDEMALWLLRALVVENITVRREGALLFLPASPTFRIEHEIKNIVTALAKTHHYWQEHMRSFAQRGS